MNQNITILGIKCRATAGQIMFYYLQLVIDWQGLIQ